MNTKKKGKPRKPVHFSADGTGQGQGKNGAPINRGARPGFQHPKTEVEAAIQRFVDLYDFAPVAYVSFDRVGRIEEANFATTQLFGRPRHLLIGSPFALYVAKEDSGLFLNHLLHCRSSKDRVETELHLKKRNGAILLVHLTSAPVTSSVRDGVMLHQTAIVDLTERRRAEEKLQRSEELHRALVSQTAVGMARSNLKGKLVFVNPKFCEMLGYRQSQLIGKSILDITHRDDIPESRRLFQRIVRHGEPYYLEKRYIRRGGSPFWVNVSASPMRDSQGKTQSVISVIVDIRDRKRVQAELEDSKAFLEKRVRERTSELVAANEELQNEIGLRKRLEGEIIGISDREQRRLGQDLHDSLCQHLTAIAFMSRAVARRLNDHRVVEVGDIEKIATLINEGVTEARTIARGLHPVDMDPAGLPNALRAFLHEQSKLPYCLDFDEEISISDPTVALHLFRIAREAIINANKHAGASELLIRTRRRTKEIELSVTDDGAGPPRQFVEGPGMGFHIMEYRARSIGARLEITPVKPHGTCVACYLPADTKSESRGKAGSAAPQIPVRFASTLNKFK